MSDKFMGENPKLCPIDSVAPNDWNPNKMSARKFASLRYSLVHDGWSKSQPLFVWRTDEKGERKMIIIDGEHRWKAGKLEGFEKVPMVFVDGIKRRQAMRLTIKLDQNRGQFEADKIRDVVQAILEEEDADVDTALDLGFEEAEFAKIIADDEPPTPTAPKRRLVGGLRYQVLIDCNDEDHQTAIMERLEEEGLKCKPMVI